MGAEHDVRALGHLVDLVDEDRALLLELGDDVDVVHDLLAHVDRRAVVLERLLDGDHGPVDAGAVAARRRQQHPLRVRRPGYPGGARAAAEPGGSGNGHAERAVVILESTGVPCCTGRTPAAPTGDRADGYARGPR